MAKKKTKRKRYFSVSVKTETLSFYCVRARSAKQARKLFDKKDKSAVEYVTKVQKTEEVVNVEAL